MHIGVHMCMCMCVLSLLWIFRKLKMEISAGLFPTSSLHSVAHMQRVELKMVLEFFALIDVVISMFDS